MFKVRSCQLQLETPYPGGVGRGMGGTSAAPATGRYGHYPYFPDEQTEGVEKPVANDRI